MSGLNLSLQCLQPKHGVNAGTARSDKARPVRAGSGVPEETGEPRQRHLGFLERGAAASGSEGTRKGGK